MGDALLYVAVGVLAVGVVALAAMLVVHRRKAADELDAVRAELQTQIDARTADATRLTEQVRRITAQREQADQRLREAEALYQSLLQGLPLNLFRKDLQGHVVMANQRYCDTLQLKLADVTGKTDHDLFPKDLADKYRRDDLTVIESGAVFEDVERHRRPNGEWLYVQVFKSPVRDAAGTIIGVQGMFWDVTARRRAEESLLQERFLLRSLLDNVPDSIYFKDTKGRFIRINRSLAQRFRLADPAYAEGKTDFDFFTREHALPAYQDEQQIIRTEKGFVNKEEQETWVDGRRRWVSTTKMPLRDKDGKVIGTFGISRDITDRKLAEEAVRDSADRTRLIIDTAYDAFVAMDADGKIIDWNPQAERIFGWSRQEAIGRTVAETIVPPEFRGDHAAGLAHFLATGEGPLLGGRQEVTALRRDGTLFEVEVTITPIRRGESFVFNAFLHDITDRKRQQGELRRAKDAAEAASQAKSTFLANMSHEIRTPLNAVLGMTDLVLDTELTPIQREYLTVVQESGDALLSIIGDILDFSKIEAGHLDLENAPFNLHDHLEDTVKLLALRAHHKGLELACRIGVGVPQFVIGDKTRLRQVMVNLLGNAIKFTEHGEVLLDVRCDSRDEQAADIHFAVRDTGIGIAPDKHSAVFDAFEQADNTMTRRFGGTGLGLAISSRLVRLMGGRIWLESEVGHGSTFHFTTRFELDTSATPLEGVNGDVEGLRVLVVDDHATSREILVEMLGNWRMRAESAGGLGDALGQLHAARRAGDPFAVVLCDATLPQDEGFELIQRLQEEEGETPPRVIVLLAPGQRPGDVARCERMGISSYLMKPVKQSELFDALVADAPRGAPVIALSANGNDGDGCRLRPLRVLLAEDSLVNQKLAVGLMGKHGHQVTLANTGKEALDALAKDSFDVVLMDVQMPELDGLEATRTIRRGEQQTGKHVPIVAMTAHALKGDRELCLGAGMDAYVTKPVRAGELFRAIADAVGPECQLPPGGERSADPPAAKEPTNGEAVMDWSVALDAVQGDEDLLREIVSAFLEEYPGLVAQIRHTIEAGDGPGLRLSAHRLKGSMRYFAATQAFDRAYTLETRGRDGCFEGAGDVLAQLEKELAKLAPQLKARLSG